MKKLIYSLMARSEPPGRRCEEDFYSGEKPPSPDEFWSSRLGIPLEYPLLLPSGFIKHGWLENPRTEWRFKKENH